MNKIIKYAPLAIAIAWLACSIVAVLKDKNTYRIEFIIASLILVIIYLARFAEEVINARKAKRSDNKH